MQLEFNYTHERENNSQSQDFIDSNRNHLNAQCQKVYDLLKSGHRLTVISAMNDHQVMSLPRRILDLERSLNIKINRETTGRIMTYFL